MAPPKYSTNHEMAYTIMDFLFASQVRRPGDTCSWAALLVWQLLFGWEGCRAHRWSPTDATDRDGRLARIHTHPPVVGEPCTLH